MRSYLFLSHGSLFWSVITRFWDFSLRYTGRSPRLVHTRCQGLPAKKTAHSCRSFSLLLELTIFVSLNMYTSSQLWIGFRAGLKHFVAIALRHAHFSIALVDILSLLAFFLSSERLLFIALSLYSRLTWVWLDELDFRMSHFLNCRKLFWVDVGWLNWGLCEGLSIHLRFGLLDCSLFDSIRFYLLLQALLEQVVESRLGDPGVGHSYLWLVVLSGARAHPERSALELSRWIAREGGLDHEAIFVGAG